MARSEDLIAVFDSGLGGISVLRELVRQMPCEHFLYFGDSANAPYGSRETAEVRALTLDNMDRLMARGVKAAVIACNTATSAAVDILRERFPDTIIVGIEPALKLAASRHPEGRIIVMATEVTLREEKFLTLMQQYQCSHEIVRLPSPRLVEFVEHGQFDGDEVEGYLRNILTPCLTPGTRAIVLGCTHFPFLRPVIARIAGPGVQIVDGGEGVAAQTRRRLAEGGLLLTEGQGSILMENSLHTPEILALGHKLLHLAL